ncbi:MAG: hypothetical protein M9932_00640 [Xanthobacteraceae bacterium]|nr:hypothetical protein [Xanthobacteraceae bacterium]
MGKGFLGQGMIRLRCEVSLCATLDRKFDGVVGAPCHPTANPVEQDIQFHDLAAAGGLEAGDGIGIDHPIGPATEKTLRGLDLHGFGGPPRHPSIGLLIARIKFEGAPQCRHRKVGMTQQIEGVGPENVMMGLGARQNAAATIREAKRRQIVVVLQSLQTGKFELYRLVRDMHGSKVYQS